MGCPDTRTPHKTITINEALALAHEYGKSVRIQTLIKWIDIHVPKLGHQPGGNGGQWFVFEQPFIAFISGQEDLCQQLLKRIAEEPTTKEEL